jgi:hypothetical protein
LGASLGVEKITPTGRFECARKWDWHRLMKNTIWHFIGTTTLRVREYRGWKSRALIEKGALQPFFYPGFSLDRGNQPRAAGCPVTFECHDLSVVFAVFFYRHYQEYALALRAADFVAFDCDSLAVDFEIRPSGDDSSAVISGVTEADDAAVLAVFHEILTERY